MHSLVKFQVHHFFFNLSFEKKDDDVSFKFLFDKQVHQLLSVFYPYKTGTNLDKICVIEHLKIIFLSKNWIKLR